MFENDIVEIRRSDLCTRDVAVVCVFGNGAPFPSVWDEWSESCARHCFFAINVKHRHLDQAKYSLGANDVVGTKDDDLTGSDQSYTFRVLHGVCDCLVGKVTATSWLIHGASGGAVTACALVRQLLSNECTVVGLLVDCGVPGNGEAFAVPVAVFRSKQDPYWNAVDEQLFSIWVKAGYTINMTASCSGKHAWIVDEKCMRQCLEWYENVHGVQILPRHCPTTRARLV